MASSVFYRFRHQKDLSRITFDGTGISVFELKRDVITQNKLGEGTDFELTLYNEEGDLFEDDTTIIPRSTTVIARRSPARQHGKGGAARYVSGRMPVNALSAKKTINKVGANGIQLQAPEAQTEEEKLSAILQSGKQEWEKQQEVLESSMPIRRPPNKADIPDKPPPPGYVCYRCGEKGHWIQACPTNDDPNYVSQPRFKRTTGIPKSMLVKVDKSDFDEEEERPAGLMLSADGDWVMAKSDYEEFRKYQAKVRQSKVAQQEEKQGSKELQERGLECPLDKRLFVEPMKTPCCSKTYCSECINNALIENDLHCPNCKSDLLFDDLTVDEEKRAAVRTFDTERTERAKENAAAAAAAQANEAAREASADENSKGQSAPAPNDVPQPSIEPADRNGSDSPDSKKRKADLQLDSNRAGSGPPLLAPKGPAAQRDQPQIQQQAQQQVQQQAQQQVQPQQIQQQQQQQQPQQQQQNPMAGFQNPMMWGMSNGQWPMNMPMPDMDGMGGMAGMMNMGNMQWQQQSQQQQQQQQQQQPPLQQQQHLHQVSQGQDGNWQQGNRGGRNQAGRGRRR